MGGGLRMNVSMHGGERVNLLGHVQDELTELDQTRTRDSLVRFGARRRVRSVLVLPGVIVLGAAGLGRVGRDPLANRERLEDARKVFGPARDGDREQKYHWQPVGEANNMTYLRWTSRACSVASASLLLSLARRRTD